MEPWEKFWMLVLGFAVFGVGTTFVNLYANSQYAWGRETGYWQGYSDAKANRCLPMYIGDCEKKAKIDKQ